MAVEVALILLGTNMGDRVKNLAQAREFISNDIAALSDESLVYETAAWGKTDQPSFLNQVVAVSTDLEPMKLLEALLNIEEKMGRLRMEKWGARTIDLDILYLGQKTVNEPRLKIPHPAIAQRRFTLVPLNDCWADYEHPILKKTQAQLLRECADTLEVLPFKG